MGLFVAAMSWSAFLWSCSHAVLLFLFGCLAASACRVHNMEIVSGSSCPVKVNKIEICRQMCARPFLAMTGHINGWDFEPAFPPQQPACLLLRFLSKPNSLRCSFVASSGCAAGPVIMLTECSLCWLKDVAEMHAVACHLLSRLKEIGK